MDSFVKLNIQTVEAYLEGFRRTDRDLILSCLTDDVEWLMMEIKP